MTPIITAFKSSPDRGRGLARDMRVRWALEEVGQPYDVQLVSFTEMKEPAYLALQPFGQIPAYKEGDLVLFESGAIILRIAETHDGLLPKNENARSRAIMWMFAAVNTIELPILNLEFSKLLERDKPWYQERLPALEAPIHARFKALSHHLGEKDWLEGEFTAGDIMMVNVLRRPSGAELLGRYPNLAGYIARAEARPAYQRAFAAQLAVFKAASTGETK